MVYISRYCSSVIGASSTSANAAFVAWMTACVSSSSVPFQSQTRCVRVVPEVIQKKYPPGPTAPPARLAPGTRLSG
ncbi:hypothetical protein GA0115255_103061 [Streptomyces sp. Ncost-T6T-2b]|nr:hypothetical protein GA0115255_103061 [Streptomyces sp. Ncost-T6T-2b]